MKILKYLFVFLIYPSAAQIVKASFEKEVIKKLELNYLLDIPETKTEIPLIVFLHGMGESGSDLEKVKNNVLFANKEKIKEKVAILVPQCPENIWWDTQAIYELINEITSKYKINKKRIYLTGLSMGGWGTIKLAIEHPELFAKIAPICAPVDDFFIVYADKLKDKPIKLFHGAMDDVVSVNYSINFYKELKKTNPKAELVIFPYDNHNSWDSTYSNDEFFKWFLGN